MNDAPMGAQPGQGPRFIPAAVPSQQAPRPSRQVSGPPVEASLPNIEVGFNSIASFEFMQRAARALSTSTQIPIPFRALIPKRGNRDELVDNPNALANCMVALTMAQNMRRDVISVMWNLDVVEGRPAWRGQFVIALVNTSGLYKHALRFDLTIDENEREYTYEETYWENRERFFRQKTIRAKPFRCVAWTLTPEGERLEGEPITMEMAIAEGWYQKAGSKWQTMLGQMARYRAGVFFARVHCPHVLYGLSTDDELRDIIDAHPTDDGWKVRADEEGRAEPVEEATTATTGETQQEKVTDATTPADAGDGDGAPRQLTHQAPGPTVGDLLSSLAGSEEAETRQPEPATTSEPKRERVRRRFAPME
jgi:hypothetical protein